MSLPPFDRHGNLPVGQLFGGGLHHSVATVTLREIHERFVQESVLSTRRPAIWAGWMRHRSELEALGVQYATLVNGSFVTIKPDPGDVDLCVLLDAQEIDALDLPHRAELARLLRGPGCKAEYLCDAYPLVLHPFSDPRFAATVESLTYWTRVFGIDRNDRQKSFLLVNERGIL